MYLNRSSKKKLCRMMASNLPIFRTQLRLSQEDMAEKLGVTRQTISAFEGGQREMPWSMFLACLIIFLSNESTNKMLTALEIYTDQLKDFLAGEQEKSL